jgi:hypothetical protein
MAEKMTKQEAVRRALNHFGRDARPSQMQGWIKEQFGIEMSTDHISTAKGNILHKPGGKGKSSGMKKPAVRKSAVKAAPAPKSADGARKKDSAIPLDDILYVKGLVGRFGPGPLHTLIDAFAE